MTALGLFRVLVRRWYVVLAGGVVTVSMCMTLLISQPLFWTQSDVLFVAPGTSASDHFDDRLLGGLTSFAAAVERLVNEGRPPSRLASASAPIYGAGIREGYSIAVPNVGGQWEASFARPVLSVEVVDRDPARVRGELARLLGRVRQATYELQRRNGVAPEQMIKAVAVPQSATVSFVGSSRRGQARALAAAAVLGIALTLAAAAAVDSLPPRRRPRARRKVASMREGVGEGPVMARHPEPSAVARLEL